MVIHVDDTASIERSSPKEYNVYAINTLVKKQYPELRQKSKVPTFLLTYGGKHYGLMQSCGFSKSEALTIERSYHTLYKVSDDWVKSHIDTATRTGFVTAAFGLKVRTPLLKRSLLGNRAALKESEKESRTAGNALGQSWCMLNSRAASEFLQRVRASPYRYKIKLSALIHDAIYLYCWDDLEVLEWVNKHLPECMAWQEDPLIQHDKVKLSGELEIYYPAWSNPIAVPEGSNQEHILALLLKEKSERDAKASKINGQNI